MDIAAADHKLMIALEYGKYVAKGGEWGSMILLIARIMGFDFHEHCVAVHLKHNHC